MMQPPKPLIPEHMWAEFCEWAHDCGYGQEYFNRWDSRSLEIQERFLEELADEES